MRASTRKQIKLRKERTLFVLSSLPPRCITISSTCFGSFLLSHQDLWSDGASCDGLRHFDPLESQECQSKVSVRWKCVSTVQLYIRSHLRTCPGPATQANALEEHEGATAETDLSQRQDEPQERRQEQSRHGEARRCRTTGQQHHGPRAPAAQAVYLLHCCDAGEELPKLDRRFVTSVVKVLCKVSSSGRPPSAETQVIMDALKDFYEQCYKAYMSEELSYERMSTVIEYLSTDVITIYENNIKQNYVAYVERYKPLKDKTVVAIDPNMSDLLYCVDGDTKDQTRFRYTQGTRRRETKVKKYRDYVQERK